MANLDRRHLADELTEVVSSYLHYFDALEKVDVRTCSAGDVSKIAAGWIERYKNDLIFHNKVDSVVAQLIISTDKYITSECAQILSANGIDIRKKQ